MDEKQGNAASGLVEMLALALLALLGMLRELAKLAAWIGLVAVTVWSWIHHGWVAALIVFIVGRCVLIVVAAIGRCCAWDEGALAVLESIVVGGPSCRKRMLRCRGNDFGQR